MITRVRKRPGVRRVMLRLKIRLTCCNAGATINATDFALHQSVGDRDLIATANALSPITLSEAELRGVLDFLHALTDPASLDMRGTVPTSVPSGLPIFD